MHTDFSGGRSGGLLFSSLEEFSTVFVIHTVKGFGVVNKEEIDVFLELSCFFDDPVDGSQLLDYEYFLGPYHFCSLLCPSFLVK